MKKQKYYVATGAILCFAFAGLACPMSNTFADNPLNHWMVNTGLSDHNLFRCVVEAYKDANNVDDDYLIDNLTENDPLPAEGLAKIENLICASANVTDATGIDKLPNL